MDCLAPRRKLQRPVARDVLLLMEVQYSSLRYDRRETFLILAS